jgi:alkylation response protein AidB-like acyl-CoA dehydrogenase
MKPTAKRLLADIQILEPMIFARAAEIEAARRIPIDIVDALRATGIFRMFAPRSHDGLELELSDALDVLTALARIDGSIGWITMIGSASGFFLPLLPRALYDRIYRDGPDLIIAGSTIPGGTAEAADGGWRVNGRWPFASGCQHADFLIGLCVMTENGTPLPEPASESGQTMVRVVLLPASEWQIEDTWHVAGLKGTGSHHIVIKDRIVPADHFVDLAAGVPCVRGPLYDGVQQLIPLVHGPIAIGLAEGAMNDLVAKAGTGWQQQRAVVPARDSELFQVELGRIGGDIRAARALLRDQAEMHWRHALAGTLRDAALTTQAAQTAVWITATCLRAVETCFALGGSSALYESSTLQRRLRDLQAAAQHAMVQQRHYAGAAKLLFEGASAQPNLAARRSAA